MVSIDIHTVKDGLTGRSYHLEAYALAMPQIPGGAKKN